MTKGSSRPHRTAARHGRVALVVLAIAVVFAGPAAAAGRDKAHAKAGARSAHVERTRVAIRHKTAAPVARLSIEDEYDRADLIDQMLSECRGIKYNAYELAQSSGAALMLPAPIQLVTVRVRHPYCAELLRAYAPKTRV